MPALTRRRSPDAPDECWHLFYGDMRVGTIAIRTGMPPGEDPCKLIIANEIQRNRRLVESFSNAH